MAITASLDVRASSHGIAQLFLYSKPLRSGGHRLPVLLHHLSSSGMLIECSYVFAAGDQLELAFSETMSEAGDITWIGPGLYGFQFHKPVATPLIERTIIGELQEAVENDGSAPVRETFGTRLQQLRIAKGMTQIEVAGQLGLSAVSVSNWESDRSLPRHHRLADLAKILRVREQELVTNVMRLPVTLPEVLASSKYQVATLMGIEPGSVKISVDF